MPSLFEQQPVVLLEALAARIPIIASKVTVLSNVASESCIVVEPAVEGIADGIEAFARMDPKDVQEMVDDGFLKVKQLSWDAIIDSYIGLYAEVAATSKSR